MRLMEATLVVSGKNKEYLKIEEFVLVKQSCGYKENNERHSPHSTGFELSQSSNS